MSKRNNEYQLWKSCVRKKQFQTRAEAEEQKGMEVYLCRHCGHWHRNGGINKFVKQLQRWKRK